MELEKIVQSQGFGSRRQCRQLISWGHVQVNGEVCTNPKARPALDGLVLTVGEVTVSYREKAIIALHKPAGYECSRIPKHHPSVFRLLPEYLVERDLQTVGRLDVDTTGLLLLTDDGQLNHRLTSPKHKVPKTYRVWTAEVLTDAQRAQLLAGVVLEDDPDPVEATACDLVSPQECLLTLTAGKYHQVKRMLAAVGNHVSRLHREQFGQFALPEELAEGEWCWLEAAELGL